MGDSRKDVLLKALEAEALGGPVDRGALFTDDVVGWSPFATVSGLKALDDLADVHDMSFSNVTLVAQGTRRGGQQGVRRVGGRGRSHRTPGAHGGRRPRADGTACHLARCDRGRLP